MDKYIFNDLSNPTYLFHGSPKKLDILEPRQSIDSNGNIDNIDCAVFLTSSFIAASAYAFKDKIKEISDDLDWKFKIGYDRTNDRIYANFCNVNIDDDMEGYIYVFPFNDLYNHTKGSIQYKCYENITPIDVLKVKFSDFKEYYSINENEKSM